MTLLGIVSILLGLLTGFKAFLNPTRVRVVVFILAYLMHLGATFAYYVLIRGGPADAWLYYYDFLGEYGKGIGLSTTFIVYFVQSIKSVVGGTFLDYFMMFHSIGFLGIVLLMRIFEEVYAEIGAPQPFYSYAIFFLPSLHYWTCAVGKEPLFFLGTVLCIWSLMRFKHRLVALAIGLGLLFVVRPHIALITMAALSFSIVRDSHIRLPLRIALAAVGLVGVAFAIALVRQTFRIELVDVNVFSDALAAREATLETEEAGRTAVRGSYPIRVLSFLFRPFFFDASGVLGLIVSLENVLVAVIFGVAIYRWRPLMQLARSVLYVRFAMISSLSILLLLSITYYNVGLGIRQKATMILPGFLVVFVSLLAVVSARRRSLVERRLHPVPVAGT